MRWFARGLVVALLSSACSVGLVVQTAVPSQALVDVDLGKIAEATIGKTKQAAPMVGKGVRKGIKFTNAAGWLMTASQFAWWAFDGDDKVADFLNPCGDSTASCWDIETTSPANPAYWGPVASGGSNLTLSVSDTGTQLRVTATNNTTGRLYDAKLYTKSTCSGAGLSGGGTGASLVALNSGLGTGWGSAGSGYLNAGGTRTATISKCSDGDTSNDGYGIVVADTGSVSGGSVVYSVSTRGSWVGALYGTNVSPNSSVTFGSVGVQARCRNVETLEEVTISSENDYADRVYIPSCKKHLGDDWVGTNLKVAPKEPKIDNVPTTITISPPVEIDFEPPAEEDPLYQECEKTKSGCALVVWIDSTPCRADGPDICRSVEEIEQVEPSRVRCFYGAREVSRASCRVLYPILREGPKDVTVPAPTAPPPATDDPELWGPITVTPRDPEDVEESNACWPSGWGLLNPVDWVLKPVKCALKWAFVPKTSPEVTVPSLAQFVRWIPVFPSWSTAACGGFDIEVDLGVGSWSGTLANTCEEPYESLSFWSRTALSVLIVSAGAWSVFAQVESAFGLRSDFGDRWIG